MSRLGAASEPDLAGRAAARTSAPAGGTDAYPVPLLEARPGTTSAALAGRLRGRSPTLVFALAMLAGYVLLAAVATAVGLLLVDVVIPIQAIGGTDESADTWLAAHRSVALNDVTMIGSAMGDTPAILASVGVSVMAAALRHRWRVAAFIASAIIVEAATYRVASLVVHRQRPTVVRLDQLPVNQSFPSGHVASAVVVYIGWALLYSSWARHRRRAIPVWATAMLLVLLVAFSRVYRGMHHPTDVVIGALVGLASIGIGVWAARASGAAARPRTTARERT